jgi:hypothetical protein
MQQRPLIKQFEIQRRRGGENTAQPGVSAKPIGISLFLAVLQFLSRMKDIAYSPACGSRIVLNRFRLRVNSLAINPFYFTVSVKLTGPSVEVDAEIVTVPAFDPVV